MKKYAIIIGEVERDVGIKVQKALLKAGFVWCTKGTKVNFHDYIPIIFVNCSGDGELHRRGVGKCIEQLSNIANAVITTPSYVIAHASELDGAKKTAQEMTLAEICAELGREIKITKG